MGSMAAEVRVTVNVAKLLKVFLEAPGEPCYGFDLMQQAKLPSGTVYPILARLERAQWIAGQLEDIDPVSEGRPARRYYRLTPEGMSAARVELARLSQQLSTGWPYAFPRPANEGGFT